MPGKPITPGSTIGIIGGGQLGRMLAIAAARLGYRTHIFTPEKDSPARQVACETTVASYDDEKALLAFAASVAVVTYEFENIPHASLELLEKSVMVSPSADILRLSQHRGSEKRFCNALGIGTAPFAIVKSPAELDKARREIGVPGVLKTTRLGYDGKGQAIVRRGIGSRAAWDALATDEAIYEGVVDFACEISVIVARNEVSGSVCYVPVQNIHKNGILDITIAPAPLAKPIRRRAASIAKKIAEELDLRGILAVEMFVCRDGEILVNELAPRPHNSGHWTLDACVTDQFEQAIRAVCGLPLGSARRTHNAVMHNLIGADVERWAEYLEEPDTKLHLYGKTEARPGRKMGHITRLRKKKKPRKLVQGAA